MKKTSRCVRHSPFLSLPLQVWNWLTLLFFTLCCLLLPAQDAFSETKDTTCIDLLVGKCRECHYLTRICQSLDKKSKRQWQHSVRTMVLRGAEVSSRQEEQIVACLAAKASDVVLFCDDPPPLKSMPPLKYPNGVKK